ncbi:MAG: glycosyltransferase, partial [Lachnospiraceae bacterium]|nr:glycosyltransferase [Lachnospiraceae bacterium]
MSEPIRILQVLGRLDRGGAETMILNLYRHMDREQLQFDFVIHTEDVCDYTEEVLQLGGKIYSMKPFRVSTALAYRKQWRLFFREHPEYRVIHGHMRSTASLYLSEAKRAGLVTIVHSHNTSSGSGIAALVKNVLQYPLRYQADYLFACGRKAGEWLYGKKACDSPRFRLLLNGIETDRFRFLEAVREEKRHELGIGADDLVFLHI